MTSSLHLAKYHGLGNDFLLVLDEAAGIPLAIEGDLARRLCDRHRGIGADGLIHGALPDERERADGIDVVMRLFNADGSRAEISGNGIRCLAHAVARLRGFTEGDVIVSTDAGRRVLVCAPGPDEATLQVSVEMGSATVGPTVPAAVEQALRSRHATVDVGNPHLVVELDGDLGAIDVAADGAELERSFADGINVEYIRVEARDRLRLRVWERGAGITEACGSGACASVHVAHGWGVVDDEVVVVMPGGDATVRVETDGTLTLTGPSVHIADAVVSVPAGADVTRTRATAEV